jgi:hypothetical protein
MAKPNVLSNFLKIASTKSINVLPVDYPNNLIDISVVHQVMGKIPQMKFFNPEAVKKISYNKTADSTYINETGRGKIEVVNTKDFYIGEGTV